MINARTAPYSALLLRVSLGGLLLAHAGQKLFIFTPSGTEKFFSSLGLPGWFGLVVMAGEVICGLALILGIYARIAAVLMIADLLGAIFMVHIHNGFFFTNTGGGWEYPAFWAITLVVQVLLGDGAYAVYPKNQSM